MLHTVTVINESGDSLDMELGNPEASGFIVKSIDGLTPGKAIVNTKDYATIDGSIFNSARLSMRNIVLNLGYWEVPSVEINRHKSYRYFPIKQEVELIFKTDTRNLKIKGYVESNEANIFSKEETTQISIICPDPYFRLDKDTNYIDISIVSSQSLFEFPFSNEHLTNPLLIMGNLTGGSSEANIIYNGTRPTSIDFIINIIDTITSDIILIDRSHNNTMILDYRKISNLVGGSIKSGDVIYISTALGNKKAYLKRGEFVYNIINSISRDSTWFMLEPGATLFTYQVRPIHNVEIYMSYDELFEGI